MNKNQNNPKPLWCNAFVGGVNSKSNLIPVKSERNFLSHSELVSESKIKIDPVENQIFFTKLRDFGKSSQLNSG